VIGDLVIVAASGQLVAYDAATGNRRWLGPAGGGSYSSPQLATIDGVAQVILISGAGTKSIAPADGKELWLSGRYDNEVYAINTANGSLIARIAVGVQPHGLCVWPQPGRFSLGHTGNMR